MKQGSEQHLNYLLRNWEANSYPCPKCGKRQKWSDLAPLMMNSCPKCHDSFYMPRKLGDYFLFEPAGGGGMGTVYKAVSNRFPGLLLAVKLITRAAMTDPDAVRALLNECKISAKFQGSEFLAPCLATGCIENETFSVMQYLIGERLDKRIERCGKLPVNEVLAYLRHLLAAEQHIVNCGYLYRDMKPENVMISPEGYAILFDFGLCVPLEEAANPHDEYISGSPYYLPPERLLGEPENMSSEIYSLGMLVYHALTGHTLYDAKGLEELAHRHVTKLRISNQARMQEIPAEIANTLSWMIGQEPKDRPQSFHELLDALPRQ